MPTPFRSRRTLVATAVLGVVLASCDGGDDLETLHTQALNDAARESVVTSAPGTGAGASGEPDTGAANPTTGDAGAPGSDANASGESDAGVAAPATAIDPDDYVLVFQDEFSGSKLDEVLWNTAMPWGPDVVINGEQQYYVDAFGDDRFAAASPFALNGETLTITASETPEALRAAANEQPWLSGALTTAGKFAFTHGYAEARVELPEGQGLWPSFWMLGSETDGLLPQLFVMERDGARPASVFHNYEYVDEAGDLRSPGQFETIEAAGEDLSEGFHTVGVAWSPEELLFFVDGVPRYRIVGDDVPDEDMYLVLTLAMGGTWPGATDASTPRPAEWVVDYVRVWQKREEG